MQAKSCYILLFVFIVLGAKSNFAQQSVDSVQQMDTVRIWETSWKRPEDKVIYPKQLVYQSQNDVSEALQQQTSVQINSYGLGNSSSISIRGANDDHTNVYWNGLKINSLSLGGTDISLIPFESGTEFLVETNNVSFGGAVNINNKPNWNNKIDLSIRSDIGSFDSYRNRWALNVGNKKVQFHSSAFYHTAENNFTYIDVYKFNNPLDTIEHNALKCFGTVNHLFFQLKKQTFISVGSWFQKKDKELPAIMGSNEQSSKFQKDELIRHYINIDKYGSASDYHFSLAHSFDEMKYTDKRMPTDTFLFINSDYKTNRISNSFTANNTFRHGLSLQTGYFYNINMANVKEYSGKVTDHVGEVYAQLNWKYKTINTTVKITQPFSSIKYVRPQFYTEAGYSTSNRLYSIQISYSDKYRYPDLNDRYWNPGGNPDLKPEYGWTVNLGNYISKEKNGNLILLKNNIYYSEIKNNIVWTPVTNIFWTPENLKSTRLYGMETEAGYTFTQSDKWYLYLNTIYDFNRSQISEDENNPDLNGHYLRYRPQHTFKASFYIEQQYAGIGLNYFYTSTRYTDEENFDFFALKPYHLLDVYLTFKATVKEEHHLQFIFKINNITNTSYESIRSYAQPMRYYSMSFIYNFSTLQDH